MKHPKTKIVCTLGPSSDSTTELEKMLEAGMNVARLNFSHGSYEHMKKIVDNLRAASQKTGIPVALLQDLQGPKIRLGTLPQTGIPIKKGETIILSTEKKPYASDRPKQIPVQYLRLHEDVKKGDLILIDDGYIEVTVIEKKGKHIFCKVQTSGTLKSHKGINCPTATISAKTITSKDLKDLEFGLTLGIDYVALSFVKSAEDIQELRTILTKKGHPEIHIIAKIERHEAMQNLESIAEATDGLMVARGDLGIEIPAEQVPMAQKEIVRLGLWHGKPVIIATQILESMIQNPRATRAEISDAATATFDHADALMLSGESSVGKYPIRAVKTLAKVAHAVEHELEKRQHLLPPHLWNHDLPIKDATCYSAAVLAEEINAAAILIITETGYTARQIMKHRPRTPVIAMTSNETVKRQLQLVWGIREVALQSSTKSSLEEMISSLLAKQKSIKKGQEIVLVNAQKEKSLIKTVLVN